MPNANYLWINQFATALNENGRAALVMANSASDAGNSEKDIRVKLIESGIISQMVTLPSNMFTSVTLPATLWFFDKGKPEAIQDKVLFLDARNYYTVVDRTLNEWSEWQLKNLNAIVWLYRGEVDKYHNLLKEYQTVLGCELPFAEKAALLTGEIAALRAEAKKSVEDAAKREKKKVQAEYDEKISALEEILTIAKEAVWLYEKIRRGQI